MPVSHWEFLRQHQLTQLIKQLITQLGFKLFSSGIRQWGTSLHGWVSFPVMFNSYRVIISNHQGTAFYNTKPRESDTLGGFTLDVGSNNDISMDAYWIAIGL